MTNKNIYNSILEPKIMEIYSKEPKDWKELQDMTSKLLSEIGYKCEIEKNVKSIRNYVNIDVYAENITEEPNSIIICECKNWAKAIPQNIVHSFRTVAGDIGANYGFIISRKGFQKGAVEAIENTNIKLFTWIEFTNYFKNKWVKSMTKRINIKNRPLLTYVGIAFPTLFKNEYQTLNKEQLDLFNKLTTSYFNTTFNSLNHEYKDLLTEEFNIKYFEENILKAEKEYHKKFSSYEDFFIFLEKDAKQGIKEFDNLFCKQIRRVDNT